MTRCLPVVGLVIAMVLPGAAQEAVSREALGQNAEQGGHLREAFQHYLVALQESSVGGEKEQALRTKVLTLATRLNPPPVVPEEAQRFLVRGQTALKMAQGNDDLVATAAEFQKAIAAAPWLAAAYYNLALVQAKIERYDEAMANFRNYLSGAPEAPDAQEVKEKIYALEFQKERAATEAAKKEAERQKDLRRTQGLAGAWKNPDTGRPYTVTVTDRQFEARNPAGWILRGTITDTGIEGTVEIPGSYVRETACTLPSENQPWTGTVSDDSNTIVIKHRYGNYNQNYKKGGWLLGPECYSVTLDHYEWETFKIVRVSSE